MKRIVQNGQCHLCLFATKDIGKNEQLFYDYGVPDKELPWVKVSTAILLYLITYAHNHIFIASRLVSHFLLVLTLIQVSRKL